MNKNQQLLAMNSLGGDRVTKSTVDTRHKKLVETKIPPIPLRGRRGYKDVQHILLHFETCFDKIHPWKGSFFTSSPQNLQFFWKDCKPKRRKFGSPGASPPRSSRGQKRFIPCTHSQTTARLPIGVEVQQELSRNRYRRNVVILADIY